LPPVNQGRKFYPLDSSADPKLQKQAVEMCFDRPAIHPYSHSNLFIAATLQEQVNNLLLAWTQPDRFRLIHFPPIDKPHPMKPASSR